MRHTESKLFPDLGRATRRGVRKCPKCGTMNGTRGKSCKNISCDVVFHDCEKKTTADEDACRISINLPHCRAFSVRIRDRGPDYRSFVQLPLNQPNITTSTKSHVPKSISFGSRCYVDACTRSSTFPCAHVKAAEKCSSNSQPITIKESVLSTISIPTEAKQILIGLVKQMPDLIVQRCSKHSFIVKCNVTSRHPLGYLHMLFFKINKEDENPEQKFLCSCQPIKLLKRQNTAKRFSNITNKFCVHFYACVCSFASNESLASEFKCVLSYAVSVYPSIILSQVHAVTDPRNNLSTEEETTDHPNQVSVEIMRENLSLLESIAAVDDHSLQQAQNLEVLADQIIVTNVDDALSFGDSSTLDSLDETDPNCTTHLTHISEILSQSIPSQHVVCQIFTSQEIQLANQSSSSELCPVNNNSVIQFIRSSPSNLNKSSAKSHNSIKKMKKSHQHPVKIGNSTSVQKILSDEELEKSEDKVTSFPTIAVEQVGISTDLERRMVLANFERWLAGVNERMNSAMNYQFQETGLLMDYITHETFDCLMSRIVSGYKKKKFPKQTMMIVRNDKPPLGTFTRHIYKIVNIIHLLHIFQSTQVPLKLSQFFIETSNGVYCEWIPSKQDKLGKQQIIPVLHCTTLKVKDMTPFLIEWIPDAFPESRIGELSIKFQVTRTGPIHTEDERKACHSHIQRLIQQSNAFSIT